MDVLDYTVNRNYSVPAAYAVFVNMGKVLLLKRYNTGYGDGCYSLPAGHVEPGEAPSDCLVREIAEEIGVRLTVFRFAHIMYRVSENATSSRCDWFFLVEDWEGNITNSEPHKCSELVWVPITSLPKNTLPYIRLAINSIIVGNSSSEFILSFGETKPLDICYLCGRKVLNGIEAIVDVEGNVFHGWCVERKTIPTIEAMGILSNRYFNKGTSKD